MRACWIVANPFGKGDWQPKYWGLDPYPAKGQQEYSVTMAGDWGE